MLGSLPKPGSLGQNVPKRLAASPPLSRLFLIVPPVRQSEQMVDVGLDRHGLPHIPLGLPILGIEGLFLIRQFPPLFFQYVHFGELFTAQQFAHRGPGRPVGGKLRLVFGKILFRVPGRLVAVKYGPGLGIVHHGPHQPGDFGEGGLGGLEFPGQRVGPVNRHLGFGRQRVIVSEIVLLQELEGGGHLFQIVDLGPVFISRALALGHALLNVNDKPHLPGRGRRVLGELWEGPLPGDHRPDVLGVKARAKGGCPEPGVLVLPRREERHHAAPPALDGKAGLLHQPEERGEVGGLFFKGRDDCQPYPLLSGGRLFPYPLAIVEKAALAVLFGILYHGQIMLQTYPVGQPPEGKAGADEIMEFPGAVKGRGVEIDVVVDVALVGMGADEKLVLAFRPAHRRFIADFVGLVRRHLAGRERLPYLEEQRPALHRPGRGRLVFAFHQQKLGGGCGRVAEVGGHGPQLLGVEPVGKPFLHCLDGAQSRRLLIGPDVGRGRGSTSSRWDFGTKCPEVLLCLATICCIIIITILS